MLAAIALLVSTASAHTFPQDKVEYHCRTAMHYITYTMEECVSQQRGWFDKVDQSTHYKKALWWGQRTNGWGDVVGYDFKLIYERVRYLHEKNN